MLKNTLISFETAKIAKEFGFNEFTMNAFYYSEKDQRMNFNTKWNEIKTWLDKYDKPRIAPFYARPNLLELQLWFLEKHNINVNKYPSKTLEKRLVKKFKLIVKK